MKNILMVLLFVSSMIASNQGFLNPEDAFKIKVEKKNDNIVFDLKLDPTIYVYDEFLKLTLNSGDKTSDLTKEIIVKKPVNYHDFVVHFDGLHLVIPTKLIKEKIGEGAYNITFEYQGCSKKGLCYAPMSKTYNGNSTTVDQTNIKDKVNKTTQNETDTITQTLKDGNIFLVLITFFGFGLLLALTPCIFPMIPILSSIIVQHSNKDGGKMSATKGFTLSLIYVLSMSIAYTIAGVLAGLFGANIQAMLQNVYVIVGFSAVFVALAFSMFGYYELSLPQSWQTALNKTSDNSSKSGGVVGIAIMGFLSALIVGPCVAPPLAGALVYIGQTGDAILGGLALFVMSLGMGVPLLAIGIGAGKYMPKPGGWMMVVSKVFGVVMLAVAIWMLDRIVPSAITIGLFAALLMGSAFYLIKNGNRYGKMIAALLMIGSMVFVKYSVDNASEQHLPFKHVQTIQELKLIAIHSKKPIMVDFWASWCVSCKEFDNITFKDKAVLKELSKYTLLKVDVTNNSAEDKELMKQFNLFGPPAMIFFKDGKELKDKRMIGFKSPEEFLKIIKD